MNNPGRLDTRCSFLEEVATTDGMGSTTITWAAVSGSPKWCNFKPLKGLERVEASKVTSGDLAKIIVRRWDDVDSSMEIDIGLHRWEILATEDHRRAGYMTLHLQVKE